MHLVLVHVFLAHGSGEMLGKDQPVRLQLIETKQGMSPLKGVMMELEDGAFPLLESVKGTSDLEEGFGDANFSLLVGAMPRKQGMERSDLLSANAAIFADQGKALSATAAPGSRVLIVGNPANTNALVAAANAPDMLPEQFMAMTRLDQSRAEGMIAEKAGVDVKDVDRVIIWGNHSATQYPDVSHARIGGRWAKDVIKDDKWLTGDFVSKVQKRGAEVIAARGASSAASAASAAIDNIRDVHLGSDKWQSIGVLSDGSYGIGGGLWYSVPCACPGLHYTRVKGLPIDAYSAKMMSATEAELVAERDAVRHLLPSSYDAGVPLQKLVALKEAWDANDKARIQEASKSLPARFQAAVKSALSS